MNAQEIFDTVVTHLIKQGKQSVDPAIPSLCLYRHPDGLRCAVGVLIPDEVYDPSIENVAACDLPVHIAVPSFFKEHAQLLNQLQSVHDKDDHWDENGLTQTAFRALVEIAEEDDLNMKVLDVP